MTFVIDNNVIISASLFKDSLPDKAFEKARSLGKIICCVEMFNELKEVVYRTKFDRYLKEADRKKLIARYLTETASIIISHKVNLCRDPKDDMYLELALSGNADCIITGDEDLLTLNPFRNIPIITPGEFLKKF